MTANAGPAAAAAALSTTGMSENRARSIRGELYYAFTNEMVGLRRRCAKALHAYNNAGEITRRQQVELWKAIINDTTPLPAASPSSEDSDLESYPWIEPPFRCDYGTNIHVSEGTFINFSCTIIDTCAVSIGPRTLLGPNVSLYSGTHPLNGSIRAGTTGPESGKPITIGADVWIGGQVTILPGVTVGDGAVVGAGSVVTKDVKPWTLVVGNPARWLRDIPRDLSEEEKRGVMEAGEAVARDAEKGIS